jgi:single-stranded-DNA-specific exonuclease
MARLDRQEVTSTDVAFQLAPRLNAAGRMGHARDALALLLADDPAEAYRLAGVMETWNRARREADRVVLEDLTARVRALGETPPAIVLGSEDWPLGVLGIAAGRALERFHRPVFLVAWEGDRGRGSARSRGFPLPAALTACADLLEEGGGHNEAAGFSIRRERFPAFQERMTGLARDARLDPDPVPLELDGSVSLEELNAGCVRCLDRLAPFGRGNPEPLFAGEGLTVEEAPSVVGRGHLRLVLGSGRTRLRAVAFGLGDRVEEIRRGARVDAAFHVAFDTYRGGDTVQLIVRDLRSR